MEGGAGGSLDRPFLSFCSHALCKDWSMGAFRPTFQQLSKGRRGWGVNAPILGVIFYLRNPGRDSIDQKEHRMSGTEDKPIPGEPPQSSDLEKPKAAHWLWRPWYAKSWWTAAAMFWLIAFFAPSLSLTTNNVAPLILLVFESLNHHLVQIDRIRTGREPMPPSPSKSSENSPIRLASSSIPDDGWSNGHSHGSTEIAAWPRT